MDKAKSVLKHSSSFSTLCDDIIAAHPSNDTLRDVILQLELTHNNQITELKRGFNAELASLRTSVNRGDTSATEGDDSTKEDASTDSDVEVLRRQLAAVEAEREKDIAHLRREMERVTEDYQRQFAKARESYQGDLNRVKASYQSLLDERTHESNVVSMIQEDNRRQTERVNEEWKRVVGNKEREIARLNRRLDEAAELVGSEMKELEQRLYAAEEEISALRRQLLDTQMDRNQILSAHRDEVTALTQQQDSLVRAATSFFNVIEDNFANVELMLSRFRVAMMDQDYESLRSRLRGGAEVENGAAVAQMVQLIQERTDRETVELTSVMESIKKMRELQASAIQDFERKLSDETEKVRELQKKKVNTHVNFYSVGDRSSGLTTPRTKRKNSEAVSGSSTTRSSLRRQSAENSVSPEINKK